MKYKAHPYADTYPMMSATELDALTEDIRTNGQENDIILYQGMILDGRNRYAACLKAGVEPKLVEFEGDDAKALAKVRSLNDHRREMTPGKWALVAARQWMLNEPDKKTAKSASNGSAVLGSRAITKHFRVAPRDLQRARELLEHAKDLVEKIEAGTPLAEAYAEWQEREKAKEQHNQDMACLGDYRERVEAGRMKFEEAMRLVKEEQRKAEEKRKNDEDSRRQWLRDFEESLWFLENRLSNYQDSQLAWFTEEGQAGADEHEITPERIETAITGLKRAQKITFGDGKNGTQQDAHRGGKKGAGRH